MEIERADTGESLTASCSGLSTLGGEMLLLSGFMVVGLIDSCCFPCDSHVRMEDGEGAVAIGGSEGDLKRVAANPSVVLLLSVLRTAIGERKEGLSKRNVVVSVQRQVWERRGSPYVWRACLISRGEWQQFDSLLFMSCTCRPW